MHNLLLLSLKFTQSSHLSLLCRTCFSQAPVLMNPFTSQTQHIYHLLGKTFLTPLSYPISLFCSVRFFSLIALITLCFSFVFLTVYLQFPVQCSPHSRCSINSCGMGDLFTHLAKDQILMTLVHGMWAACPLNWEWTKPSWFIGWSSTDQILSLRDLN